MSNRLSRIESSSTSSEIFAPASPRAMRTLPTRSVWVWWHLLSLDAPTVAVVWCVFLAKIFGIQLPWVTLPTLALGTWCVYVADRLLDGLRSSDTATLRDRHWYYLRHRRSFMFAWAVASVPLAYLIFFRVQPAVREDDIVLCLIGIAYFLLIHAPLSRTGNARSRQNWMTKEFAVGFLFAIATAVPTWARAAGSRRVLILAILTFGAVCWLNCVAIQTWEDTESEREIVHAILASNCHLHQATAGSLTKLLGRHLAMFAITLGVLSGALAFLTLKSPFYPVFASVSISSLLFVALIRNGHRCRALSLRIAADVALLTPLLFLLHIR